MVDLAKGESFSFLGFEYRRIRSRNRVWRPYYAPKLKKRTALFAKLREVFRQRQPARGKSDWNHQSDSARLGELLSDWRFEPMFLDGQAMGREEGSAAPDACSRTQGDGLETVE